MGGGKVRCIRLNRAYQEGPRADDIRPIMITLSKPAPPKRRAEAQTGGRVKRLRLSDGAGANGKSESGGEGSRSRSGSARPAIPSGVASASGSASPEKEDNTLGHNGIIELRSSDAEEEYNPEDGEEEEVEELSENGMSHTTCTAKHRGCVQLSSGHGPRWIASSPSLES